MVKVLLRGWWCFAFACQAALAVRLPGVAHGFVEGAVCAFRGVREDACDDELCFVEEGFVGLFACGDGLRALVFEVVYKLTRGPCGFGHSLKLLESHPAEGFRGRERFPRVQYSLHLELIVFWPCSHSENNLSPALLARRH